MTWKNYLFVSLLSLVLLAFFGFFQHSPGYMDAEYYYGMGLRIANESTFSEPFIWNFLSNPSGIPHPGFSFWMPLPALLSAVGSYILKANPFLGAKIIFLLLAVLIPPMTMKLSWNYTGDARQSILAGLMAVFPFLYSSFLGTTDSFGLLMLMGGMFFLLAIQSDSIKKYLLLGVLAGFFHLSRADGALWLLAGSLMITISDKNKYRYLSLLFGGYLLIMGPWFYRNWFVTGYIMSPGSSRMLWLTQYNDLFTIDSSSLSFQNWYSQGIVSIIRNISDAVLVNLKTVLLVQGEIILTPLVLVGLYKSWKDRLIRVAAAVWICIFFVMTLVFPFAGARGGLFHSGAALQPVIWMLASKGFFDLIQWGIQNRKWDLRKSQFIFGGTLIVILGSLSIYTLFNRVIGPNFETPVWDTSYRGHQIIEEELQIFDDDANYLIMLNNPPGYYVTTGRSAVVIPNGGLEDLLFAAEKYGVSHLALDSNHPADLSDLYNFPEDEEELIYLGTKSGIKFYSIKE